jgi:hypothetical protein
MHGDRVCKWIKRAIHIFSGAHSAAMAIHGNGGLGFFSHMDKDSLA